MESKPAKVEIDNGGPQGILNIGKMLCLTISVLAAESGGLGLTNLQNFALTFAHGYGREETLRVPEPRLCKPGESEDVPMKTLFTRFANDESGATAIEYGLIATLISVAIIVGAMALGNQLNTTFQGLSDTLSDPGGGGTGTGSGTST
jgi:pilus assembly protein Flp/PilA